MDFELEATRRLGRYEVLLPLAKSEVEAVSDVFHLAYEADGQRYVALHITPTVLQARGLGLFATELKRVVGFRHRNVVPILDVDRWEDDVVVACEYIPGETVDGLVHATVVAHGDQASAARSFAGFPRPLGVRVLLDVLSGLDALHRYSAASDTVARGLVHGSVGPRAILVGTDGVARLALVGLGYAHLERTAARKPEPPVPPTGLDATTEPHIAVPTGPLMDERAQALLGEHAARLDPRGLDRFSVGLMAWELFAGRPFGTDASDGTVLSPARLSQIQDVDADVEAVVHRALAVEPSEAFESVASFAAALGDATRRVGLLATPTEVEAFVRRTVQASLEARETALEAVRRTRQRRPASLPDVRTMIGLGTTPTHKRAPLPPLPTFPAALDDGRSELRIAVDRGRPADRASVGVLGPLASGSEVPDTEAQRPTRDVLPVETAAALRALSADEGEAPALPSPPSASVSPGQPLSEDPSRRPGGPWTVRTISYATAGVGLLAGFLLVGALSRRPPRPRADILSSSPSATTVDSPAAPSVGTAPVGTAPATAERTTTPPAAAEPTSTLFVQANGPIASIQIGGRLVDAVVPAPSVQVDLEEAERSKALRVVATATDGRTAVAVVGAGDRELTIHFPDKTNAKGARPAPASTVRRPWSKRGK